jgi:G:T-mismatch repair DNA endonuclease (very short patch repair protein)
MINNIWKEEQKIIQFNKQGKNNFAILENGILIQVTKLGEISIECCMCKALKKISWRSSLNKKLYICQSCNKKDKNNPFYGKRHSEETKRISSKKMKLKYIGKNNPFYGKKHSEETKQLISKKIKNWSLNNDNPFLSKSHSEKSKAKMSFAIKRYHHQLSDLEKNIISEKLSKAQKKLFNENPERYIQNKSKAAKASVLSQSKFKMNRIEKEFHDLLKANGIELTYSIILNFMQFDFGYKKGKILFEVHGDYWHGNPAYYNPQSLNKTQIKKMSRDAIKKQWAEKNGFKYIFFWESDIKNSKEKVIKEALDAIKIQTN